MDIKGLRVVLIANACNTDSKYLQHRQQEHKMLMIMVAKESSICMCDVFIMPS